MYVSAVKLALATSAAALVLAVGAPQAPAEAPVANQTATCTVPMAGTLTYRLSSLRSVRCSQARYGFTSAVAMGGYNQITGWRCTGMGSQGGGLRKGKCSARWGGKSRSFRYIGRKR